jgi:hypothetical protein
MVQGLGGIQAGTAGHARRIAELALFGYVPHSVPSPIPFMTEWRPPVKDPG